MNELQASIASLTDMERNVLIYAGKGLSNREIAATMGNSFHTISAHVQAILLKLRVSTRVEAAVIAAKCGLL
jgi:DNA-binding CsgD family transcriptional regulator